MFPGTRYPVRWVRTSSSSPILTSIQSLIFPRMKLSYDDGIAFQLERQLLQRLWRGPRRDVPRKIVGPAVTRAEHPALVFLIIHQAPQVGTDAGKCDISL